MAKFDDETFVFLITDDATRKARAPQRNGGLKRGGTIATIADEWRIPAKPIYDEVRGNFEKGDPKRLSQWKTVSEIETRLRALTLPASEQIRQTIRKWDHGLR